MIEQPKPRILIMGVSPIRTTRRMALLIYVSFSLHSALSGRRRFWDRPIKLRAEGRQSPRPTAATEKASFGRLAGEASSEIRAICASAPHLVRLVARLSGVPLEWRPSTYTGTVRSASAPIWEVECSPICALFPLPPATKNRDLWICIWPHQRGLHKASGRKLLPRRAGRVPLAHRRRARRGRNRGQVYDRDGEHTVS